MFLDEKNILVKVENENILEQKINRIMNAMQLWFDSKSYDKYWEGSNSVIPHLAKENSIETTNQVWKYRYYF